MSPRLSGEPLQQERGPSQVAWLLSILCSRLRVSLMSHARTFSLRHGTKLIFPLSCKKKKEKEQAAQFIAVYFLMALRKYGVIKPSSFFRCLMPLWAV